jgi:DNA-binding NtrC family response regulator
MALAASTPPLAPASPEPTYGPWRQHAVLVVDDEEGMRSFLTRALKPVVGLVEAAASAEEAQELFNRFHFDVVVLDNTLPAKSGVQWLGELRAAGASCDVVLITAFADLDTAINAVRAGACDFILKPFRLDQMMNALQRCFERQVLARENFVLRRTLDERAGVEGIVGQSDAIHDLRAMVRRLASIPSTVLIHGESGSGKEVAARALHALSTRSARPFVAVNCAAVAAELFESELFGHAKGAFTGATEARNGLFYYAQGGTLFLDEVSELPPAIQTKLLRVLEDRRVRPVGSNREVPVDVRILAATNRVLSDEVAAGRFREDLYYRLDVVSLRVPPLRERPADVALLARHFMEDLAVHLGLPSLPFSRAVLDALAAYPWPGNARELRNFIERSLILGGFPLDSLAAHDLESEVERQPQDGAGGELLADVEKRHILAVLHDAGGNKTEAARRLGVSRKTLERKCALWGLRNPS